MVVEEVLAPELGHFLAWESVVGRKHLVATTTQNFLNSIDDLEGLME